MPPSPGVDHGHEIGGRHIQGFGIATKLMFWMGLLMVLMVILVALLAANKLQSAMKDEIKRNGVMAVAMLVKIGRSEVARWEELRRRQDAEEPMEGTAKTWKSVGRLRSLAWYPLQGDRIALNEELIDAVIQTKEGGIRIASVRNPPVEKISLSPENESLPGLENLQIKIRRGLATVYEVVTDARGRPVKGPDGKPRTQAKTYRVLQFEHHFKGATGRKYVGRLLLSAERIEKRVDELRWLMLFLGFALMIFAIVLVYFVAQSMTMPIQSLVRDIDVVSRGDFDHVTRAQSRDEVGLLAFAFNRMTGALREAREAEREAERIESDLANAREIQANLLPPKIPSLPGFDIYPFYRSAKEVGGDYYDFFPVDRERIAILVADVSGKGIPGSIVMTQARTTIRLLAPNEPSAALTLARTNEVIAREIKRGMFVTCLYLILNVRSKEMVVCSAGHNPMALWREAVGKVELVNPNGIALGFDKGPIFNKTLQERKIQLHKGDRLVLYTDGVVEAMSPEHEEYGDDRFYRFVQQHATMRSKDFVHELVQTIDEHEGPAEQHDDITIVTLRVE